MWDIVDMLEIPIHNEKLMKDWDIYRRAISNGHGGSLPRDWFESVIDSADEERAEAAEEIRRLRKQLTAR
jgi:hypothetical protein